MKTQSMLVRTLTATLWSVAFLKAHLSVAQVSPTPQPTVTPAPYQSQSWLRTQSGAFVTVSGISSASDGAHLFQHESILPSASVTGSNFSVYRVGSQWKVAVTDHRGRLYIYDSATPGSRAGGVYYFAEKSHELIAVDAEGAYLSTSLRFENATLLGGNYFFDTQGTLHTIRANGMAPWNWAGMVSSKTGFQIARPKHLGGLFFTTDSNQIITISSETGFFSDPKPLPDGEIPFIAAGNYLISQKLNLYSVSYQGEMKFLKRLSAKPLLNGYSYFIMPGNKLNVIDAAGNLLEQATLRKRDGLARKLELLAPADVHSQAVSAFGGAK